MKKFLFAILFCSLTGSVISQTPYTYTKDGGDIILNGIVTKYLLQNDPSFNWYAKSQAGYTADSAAIQAMEASKGKVKYLVFGGTWCSDTQFVLPKFFRLQELSGVPDNNISFFAMDRDKRTIGHIGNVLNIVNVPTIIVMKDGKEVGRVVEYGKSGKWDKDLTELLK